MTTLFPDQAIVKQELYARHAKGYSRPLIVAPTGWGKGTVAGDIIHGAVSKGKRVWFIVNRRTLVHDMVKRLRKLDLNPGVLMGAQTRGAHLDVLVASVDTLRNRLGAQRRPDIAFIDEAHMFMSPEAHRLIHELSHAGVFVILLTATPWCLNRKGLGRIADTMIEGPSPDVLIRTGRLAAPVVYAPSTADLSQVRLTSTGEFDEDEAAEAMSTKKLVGDMVKHWHELAYGRRSVGFAVNRKTAEKYALEFTNAGVPSVAVDANTPDKERDKIWDQLAQGRVMVWSVGIISYGWDVPAVDCLILARPTMSLALHLQQCGRGLRAFPGKTDCLILDHAGNTQQYYGGGNYGMPDDERKWTLRDRAKKITDEDEALKITKLPRVCPKCAKLAKPGVAVCQCGYKFAGMTEGGQVGRQIEVDETGKLERVQSRVYIYPETTGDVSRDALIGVATAKGYKPAWVDIQVNALEEVRADFREVVGSEPKSHWNAGQMRAMIKEARKIRA